MVDTGHGTSAEDAHSISSSLLWRAKGRDPEAWSTLVQLFGPLVYRWCRECGLQAADAADVGQEVFAAVAAGLGSFRHDRPNDSFSGWLRTIALNRIRDHFRHLRGKVQALGGTDAHVRLAQIAGDPSLPTTSAACPVVHDSLERRVAEQIRAGVEDRTWQAFWGVAVDGRPAADVAAELGMSLQGVYSARYRVCRKIREQFRDVLD